MESMIGPLRNKQPTSVILSFLSVFYLEFQGIKAEGASLPSAPAGAGWRIVPTPNTGSPNNFLFSVAAISSNDVWAVGAYGDLGVSANQVIAHWDGTRWNQFPNPSLSA